MFRGSSDLLKRSIKHYTPVIEVIASADRSIWEIDAHAYTDEAIQRLMRTASQLRSALPEGASPILVTKVIEAVQVAGQPLRGLPEKQVLAWITQVLDVLEYLGAQVPQIIHRNVKPANIIVDANKRVRAVDFGIVSHKPKDSVSYFARVGEQTPFGTDGYSWPWHQDATPHSDLYALGATMHHLLTGHDPTKVVSPERYPAVRTLNPKISETTEAIVVRALHGGPEEPYQSAAEMKRDVDQVLNPPGALSAFRIHVSGLFASPQPGFRRFLTHDDPCEDDDA